MDAYALLFFETFFMLLFGHCLADFPLQGDYLANTKDPTRNLTEHWVPALLSHSMIHAGFVFLITGYIILALFQFFTHLAIDYAKCKGWFSYEPKGFVIDQLLHVGVLAITASIFVGLVV